MLRYNKMFWLTVDAMEAEWQRARVNARISDQDGSTIHLTTTNVTRAAPRRSLRVWRRFRPGRSRRSISTARRLRCRKSGATALYRPALSRRPPGGDSASCPPALSARLTDFKARSTMRSWTASCSCDRAGHRCRRPLGKWAAEQADYAISEWVHFFRGEPRVKRDVEVSRRRHRRAQPRALRRPVEQRHLQAHRGPAADPVERQRCGRGQRDLLEAITRRSSSSRIR